MKWTKMILGLSYFYFASSHGADEWLGQQIESQVEIEYENTCDNIIQGIIEDSRMRIGSSMEKTTSIEQIYNRTTFQISDTKVMCQGVALMSNSIEKSLRYGAYIDAQGDWILYYNF